ncbi:MAG: sialidase family protein [Candidatus Nitrosocaldus sp.]
MQNKAVTVLIIIVMLVISSSIVSAHTLSWEFYNDVLVSNADTGYRKIEAHIMRHPTDSNMLMAAFLDYAAYSGAETRCRVATSTDGGATWTDRGYIPLPTGTYISKDPVVAVSKVGDIVRWYVACLALSDRVDLYNNNDVSKIYYSTSTDNGATWSSPIVVADATCIDDNATYDYPYANEDCPIVDKPWIAVNGSNVYLCWARMSDVAAWRYKDNSGNYPYSSPIAIYFKRVGSTGDPIKLDSGTSWQANNMRSDRSVQGCNIAVNTSNGIIYVAWTKLTGDNTASIRLKRSFDNGNTFDSSQIIASPSRIPTTAGTCKDAFGCVIGIAINGQQSGFRVNNFPYLAIDSSNNLHVVWTGYASTASPPNTNIMYKQITNCTTQGQNCSISSAVNIVNEGTANKDQFHPSITFSSRTNTLIVTALDRRDSTDNTLWRPISYHCHLNVNTCTSSSHWSTSSIGPQSTNSDVEGTQTKTHNYIGSYYNVTSNAREAYNLWLDNRTVNLNSKLRIWLDRTTT